MLEEMNSGNG